MKASILLRPVLSVLLACVLCSLVGTPAGAQSHPDDVYWDDRFALPGVSGGVSDGLNVPRTQVNALASYGEFVFVGGDFTAPGSFIAAWNAGLGRWEPLGSGVDGVVTSLVVTGDDLYVGGEFLHAGGVASRGIARWHIPTRTWHDVGGGVAGSILCLEADGNRMYAAGQFAIAGDVAANNIAQWDGVQWRPLGSGGANGIHSGYAYDMQMFNGELYVALTYGFAGADTANRDLVVWNGTVWSAVARFSDPYNGQSAVSLRALAVYDATLVVGGLFDSVGTVAAHNIAQWDGVQWRALDSVGGTVRSLLVHGDTLYIGGRFDRVGSILATNIVVRTMTTGKVGTAGSGTVAPPYGGGVTTMVRAGDLYVGGDFTLAGSVAVNYVARWRLMQKEWTALTGRTTLGVDGRNKIRALAVGAGGLVAVGDFRLAGEVQGNGVAVWNGQGWTPAAGGLTTPTAAGGLFAVATGGGAITVGGDFRGIGGADVDYLAQFDGMAWRGIGVPGGARATNKWPQPWPEIHALYDDGTRLYAGGDFTTMNGVASWGVAAWDGVQWSSLGGGVDGKDTYVYAITAGADGSLYAGGSFDVVDGQTTGALAHWNGSEWAEVGVRFPGTVYAVAAEGADLYVAGSFMLLNGTIVNNIAHWNGSQWRSLDGGSSTGGVVYALAVHNGRLYAGGRFETMGGVVARNIAAWNTALGRWEPLGSGVDGVVRALAVYDDALYVGGMFSRAGGHASSGIARWSGPAVTSVQSRDATAEPTVSVFPNPVAAEVVFRWSLRHPASVSLVVCDIAGREVARIADRWYAAGSHDLHWHSAALPAGVYTVSLLGNGRRTTAQFIVVR